MFILYDFRCAGCGFTFESLEKSHVFEIECVKCGDIAHRQLSTPKIGYLRMGLDPVGNPTAGDKWADMHERGARNPGGE